MHSLIDRLYFDPVAISSVSADVVSEILVPGLRVLPEFARSLLVDIAYSPSLWGLAAAAFADALAGDYTALVATVVPGVPTTLAAAASQSATYPYVVQGVMCKL